MIEAKIISNEHLYGANYLLTLERKIDFLPGQVIALTLGKIPPRLYSLASGTGDTFLRILYSLKPEGELTPLLTKLKSGDVLSHSKARGTFLNTQKKAIWIATGTGIAPFVSMARSDPTINNYVLALLHGTQGTYHYEAELFKNLLGNKYLRYVSREPCSCSNYKQGRVTHYLRNTSELDKQAEYYLCGSAEMVVEVRDLLIEKGIGYAQIKSEIYF